MSKVYLIRPLEKKSICWHIEMYRENADGSISWVNIDDHYRWGQGFVEEDMACNLPLEGDPQATARTNVGWGAELDDQVACYFEFSDDLNERDREEIRQCYLYGDVNDDENRSGPAWLFDGEHDWQVEDDCLIIDAPYQVSLCDDDGSVIEENVKLRTREDLAKEYEALKASMPKWPFETTSVESEGGETD